MRDAIIFFGPPGAGKGTHSKAMGRLPGYHYCEMSAILQGNVVSDPERSTIGKLMNDGDLVDDRIVIASFASYINPLPKNEILLLDGVPRNVQQAMELRNLVAVRTIIFLHASFEELKRRVASRSKDDRRPDDDVDIFSKRYEIFKTKTMPVLEMFDNEIIDKVDSTLPSLDVLHEIVKIFLRARSLGRLVV